MQNVLIISYFFPPCNLTASQRVMGWANYLHKHGFYPTIITRNWEVPINKPEDLFKKSGNDLIHKKTDHYEVYYLPYRPSIRDKVFTKYEGSTFQKLSKAFTLIEMIAENFSTRLIPHRNLYEFAKKEIITGNYSALIVSAHPFDLFLFGYRLNKKYNIPWVADYRDDWNTSQIDHLSKKSNFLIRQFNKRSEKKWINSASFFTTVSSHYVTLIENFTHARGVVVLNGFDDIPQKLSDPDLYTFTLTFNGTLYPSQPVEPIINAFNRLIDEYHDKIKLQFNFPGLKFIPDQAVRVSSLVVDYTNNYSITERVSKLEVLQIQQKSDIVLMISHNKIKGIPSSKLYEYIGLRKPILLYPNDHDIIESTLKDVGLGLIADEESTIYDILKRCIDTKLSGKSILKTLTITRIDRYSRENQVSILANELHLMLQNKK